MNYVLCGIIAYLIGDTQGFHCRIGGLGEGASDKVKIVRVLPEGGKEMIEVDFGDILDGKLEDIPLQPDDVVIVKSGGVFG